MMVLVTGHRDGNRVGWTCEDHLRGTMLMACDISTSMPQEYLAVVGSKHTCMADAGDQRDLVASLKSFRNQCSNPQGSFCYLKNKVVEGRGRDQRQHGPRQG